ncbi:MAG: hypothetical protein JRI57_00135 [Deltaproteobacteria bacterium]|nr:hypothetical protein [Deltaproteobacteria bacterium]MBW1951478.1 hypothetical protein [Deltaproteobacteria bacterium]MBW1986907.1 hypothetical protein [Deltaproteobacteria bacterium]MBW2135017.1 hypothetical protein [Deltaproteobacteria bacterium]
MVMEHTPEFELAERVRPLVNEILARFNEENINPQEAGTIIIALMHRLLQALDENPEAQRLFTLSVVQLINQHLAGTLGQA